MPHSRERYPADDPLAVRRSAITGSSLDGESLVDARLRLLGGAGFGVRAEDGSAAVNGEDDAVDEASLRREQERDDVGDLVAGADAPDGVGAP